jgi:hypothetical protein
MEAERRCLVQLRTRDRVISLYHRQVRLASLELPRGFIQIPGHQVQEVEVCAREARDIGRQGKRIRVARLRAQIVAYWLLGRQLVQRPPGHVGHVVAAAPDIALPAASEEEARRASRPRPGRIAGGVRAAEARSRVSTRAVLRSA